MSDLNAKISLAIHAVLAEDTAICRNDRTIIADAAIQAYQSAKRGHELIQTSLTGIIGKAMAGSPGMCGCMGPREGQTLCPCEIQVNLTVAEAVREIEAYLAARTKDG